MRIDPSRILRVLALAALFTGGAAVLAAQEAVEKEPNNTPAQATPISLDSVVKGFANEDEEDDDWYALTIPAPGLDALIFELSAVPDEVNRVLRFCDASGKVLSDMDFVGSGEPETLVRLKQAAGQVLHQRPHRPGRRHGARLRAQSAKERPASGHGRRGAPGPGQGARFPRLHPAGGRLLAQPRDRRRRPGRHVLHRRRVRREGPFGPGSRRAGLSEVPVHAGLPVRGGFGGGGHSRRHVRAGQRHGHVRTGHRHAQRHRGLRRAQRPQPGSR